MLSGFRAPEDGLIHIGLLHGDVTGSASRYRPLRTADTKFGRVFANSRSEYRKNCVIFAKNRPERSLRAVEFRIKT